MKFITAAGSLLIVLCGHLTHAHASATLSGSCAYVLTPQRWGWSPTAGKTYDGISYGVYNFDTRVVTGAMSFVTINGGDGEPSFSEQIGSYSFNINALSTIPNAYRLNLVNTSTGVESGDYVTVLSTNGGSTFLIADHRGSGTGVCQKL